MDSDLYHWSSINNLYNNFSFIFQPSQVLPPASVHPVEQTAANSHHHQHLGHVEPVECWVQNRTDNNRPEQVAIVLHKKAKPVNATIEVIGTYCF